MLQDIIQHRMLNDDAKIDGTAGIRRYSMNGDAHKTGWMEGRIGSAARQAMDLGWPDATPRSDLCGEEKGLFAKTPSEKSNCDSQLCLLYLTACILLCSVSGPFPFTYYSLSIFNWSEVLVVVQDRLSTLGNSTLSHRAEGQAYVLAAGRLTSFRGPVCKLLYNIDRPPPPPDTLAQAPNLEIIPSHKMPENGYKCRSLWTKEIDT